MKYVIFILAQLCFANLALASIDEIIKKSKIPAEYFGVWVRGTDKTIVLNDDKLFVPASLSKIPTAGAVLSILGLNFQYETKIWMTGTLEGEELRGDLYLQGGGDPSVVSETYWVMINELKRSGVRKINGQLYVDDTLYDQKRFSESRQSRRVDRAYDAPIGAMSFNWNSVNVFVRPGKSRGEPAQVFADPENEFVKVKNLCKTGKKTEIRVERKTINGTDEISVHGSMDLGEKEQVVYKSISAPEYWAGANFKAFLNQQGIVYTGTVKKQRVPERAELLVVQKSKPLKDMVSDMSKFSNNYVAEMLTMALSTKKPSTLESGVEAIRSWMVKSGIGSGEFVFENPSGFSNENKIKPKDLGLILEKIHNDFSIAPEFEMALPVSGIDGTLKKRLKDMQGQVRAKTGYLNGKIGLAGYIKKRDQIYTFVFIYNGPEKYDGKVREVFDNFLRDI